MKKNFFILAPVIAVTIFIFVLGYTSIINKESAPNIVKDSKKISSINAKYLDGTQAKINNDSIIVYEVFASWCIPCQKNVPEAIEFQNNTNVAVTGIAYRDVEFEIEKFEKKYGKFDKTIKSNGSVEDAFGIRAVPQTIFVKNGIIKYRVFGAASSEDLKSVLALIKAE